MPKIAWTDAFAQFLRCLKTDTKRQVDSYNIILVRAELHRSVQFSIQEQLFRRHVRWFRGGRVFKAHRPMYHSTLGAREIKKRGRGTSTPVAEPAQSGRGEGFGSGQGFFFFFALITDSRRSSSLKLSDARVFEPPIRAHLGITFGKGLSGGDQDAFRFQGSGFQVVGFRVVGLRAHDSWLASKVSAHLRERVF